MSTLKRIVLDILKPHQPNGLEFAKAVADVLENCRITLKVDEVDEKTESVILEIVGEKVDFDAVQARVSEVGGSIHSIDEVELAS